MTFPKVRGRVSVLWAQAGVGGKACGVYRYFVLPLSRSAVSSHPNVRAIAARCKWRTMQCPMPSP